MFIPGGAGSAGAELQRCSLESGTAPNLETLVIKHLQIKLYYAAVNTAVVSQKHFGYTCP